MKRIGLSNLSGAAPGLALAAALTAGCATMQMVPPKDVAAKSDVFPATERSLMSGSLVDESFRLGPYEVVDVDRDGEGGRKSGNALRQDGHNVVGFSQEHIGSGFVYRFKDGAETLDGQCLASTKRDELAIGKSNALKSQTTDLVCTCGGTGAPVTLELSGKSGKPKGKVTLARGTAGLKGVHETTAAWKQQEPAGFRVGNKGEAPLGAVEVLRPGRLWLSRDLDATERRQLGCLLAGLMLYIEPAEH